MENAEKMKQMIWIEISIEKKSGNRNEAFMIRQNVSGIQMICGWRFCFVFKLKWNNGRRTIYEIKYTMSYRVWVNILGVNGLETLDTHIFIR